jgi:hypothetical protein
VNDWQALVESASKEGVSWTHMEKKTTFREELINLIRPFCIHSYEAGTLLSIAEEEMYDQIIELVKKEIKEAKPEKRTKKTVYYHGTGFDIEQVQKIDVEFDLGVNMFEKNLLEEVGK